MPGVFSKTGFWHGSTSYVLRLTYSHRRRTLQHTVGLRALGVQRQNLFLRSLPILKISDHYFPALVLGQCGKLISEIFEHHRKKNGRQRRTAVRAASPPDRLQVEDQTQHSATERGKSWRREGGAKDANELFEKS